MGATAKTEKASNVECWICKGPHKKKDFPNKQSQGQEKASGGNEK